MAEVTDLQAKNTEQEPRITRRSLLRSVAMLASSAAVAVACGPNVDLGKLLAPRDKKDFESTNTLDTFPSQTTNEGWRIMYPKPGEFAVDYVAKEANSFSTNNTSIVDLIKIDGKPTGIAAQLYQNSDGEFTSTLNVSWKANLDALVLRTKDASGIDRRVVIFENEKSGEKRLAQVEVKEEPMYGRTEPKRSIKITEMVPVPVKNPLFPKE